LHIHSHHQVDIIVGLGVRPVFKEMRVEELVIEVGNGGNVIIIRAVVHRCAPVGKWPNKLRTGRDDRSL
jgi:hypothetical protein